MLTGDQVALGGGGRYGCEGAGCIPEIRHKLLTRAHTRLCNTRGSTLLGMNSSLGLPLICSLMTFNVFLLLAAVSLCRHF